MTMFVESEVVDGRHRKTTYVVVHHGDKDRTGTWWSFDADGDEADIEHSDKPQNWASFAKVDGVWKLDGHDSDYDDAIFEAIVAKLNADGLPPWKPATEPGKGTVGT